MDLVIQIVLYEKRQLLWDVSAEGCEWSGRWNESMKNRKHPCLTLLGGDHRGGFKRTPWALDAYPPYAFAMATLSHNDVQIHYQF